MQHIRTNTHVMQTKECKGFEWNRVGVRESISTFTSTKYRIHTTYILKAKFKTFIDPTYTRIIWIVSFVFVLRNDKLLFLIINRLITLKDRSKRYYRSYQYDLIWSFVRSFEFILVYHSDIWYKLTLR